MVTNGEVSLRPGIRELISDAKMSGFRLAIAAFIVSFAGAALIHEGVLDAAYTATSNFWRPELVQDPPDMAALMPTWITIGLITSFILAGIYGVFRGALSGPAWQRGLKFGIAVWLLHSSLMAGWSGVFNLPNKIWVWWSIDALIYTIVGTIVLGIVAEKLAPTEQ
jgi:hypothetical protein